MDNNVFLYTEKRYNAAVNDGIATSQTRKLYNEFSNKKIIYIEARNRYQTACNAPRTAGQQIPFEAIQSRREMNIAEANLTTLSYAIGWEIRNARQSNRCIKRIDYR